MRKLLWLLCFLLVAPNANAAGISVDAGLTPAEDRWIFRTQLRYMQRSNDPTPMNRKVDRYVLNTVLAYGLFHNLTLLVRQQAIYQQRSVAGSSTNDTGLSDFFLLAKYGIYRLNTPEHTLGLATSLGLELPTGMRPFTSETWDIKPGLHMSWRSGTWASDINITYTLNGFADQGVGGIDPGNVLDLNLALAHQFGIGKNADMSLTPLLELSFKNIGTTRLQDNKLPNSGASILSLSPGIKFTKSSLILEALLQIPVWQEQEGSQLDRGIGGVLGLRYMF